MSKANNNNLNDNNKAYFWRPIRDESKVLTKSAEDHTIHHPEERERQDRETETESETETERQRQRERQTDR